MADYVIKFSELAAITLEDNLLFLRNFSINYSLKIRRHIIEEIDKLVIFPHSHSIYKKTDKYIYRKLTIKKRYHIIYAVDKNTITIIYILDGRQAYDRYFKSLK